MIRQIAYYRNNKEQIMDVLSYDIGNDTYKLQTELMRIKKDLAITEDAVLMNANYKIPNVLPLFGTISSNQAQYLHPFIKDQIIHDLGASPFLHISNQILKLGAKQVIAIDKEPMIEANTNIICTQVLFEEYDEPIDIAFVSWPSSTAQSKILPLIQRARLVIFLGRNREGVKCGSSGLYSYLLTREVLQYVPERPNTLIIYGKEITEKREPCEEERLGLLNGPY